MENDYKKLTRSRTNRTIRGVCGGLGEYLKVDPVIIRILFVLFGFTFWGIVVYFIMGALIPEEEA